MDIKVEQEIEIDFDNLTCDDMSEMVIKEIEKKGIAGHHISSMNKFYEEGIPQIVMNNFKIEHTFINVRTNTEEDKNIKEISFVVLFNDVRLENPTIPCRVTGQLKQLFPSQCRIDGLTYAAPLFASMDIKVTAWTTDDKQKVQSFKINKHKIASLPIMVKSNKCNLFGLPREQLILLGEDPNDDGGYLIIEGNERIINALENIANNNLNIYRNPSAKELTYAHLISKPGDAYENSYQVILRQYVNNMIYVEFDYINYKEILMPFYLLFRLMGVSSDKEIVDNIVYGVDRKDSSTIKMINVIKDSFDIPLTDNLKGLEHEYDPIILADALYKHLHPESKEVKDKAIMLQITKKNREHLYNIIDKYILPHIGQTEGHRIHKAKFLGYMIYSLLKVNIGDTPETDRNSYKAKRIHTAGPSFAKIVKTNFNMSIIKRLRNKLKSIYENSSFSEVKPIDSIINNISSDSFEKGIINAIKSQKSKIRLNNQVEIINRMETQLVERKNPKNVQAALNRISVSSSKNSEQSVQADLRRRFHPTAIGAIDPDKTRDTGEEVGMKNEIACMTSLTSATNSYILRKMIAEDPTVLHLDSIIPSEITSRELYKIFVNGDWVGCVEDKSAFIKRYRNYRRYGHLHHETTISDELFSREIKFWTDVGRFIRPLTIVYNNIEEYDAASRAGKPIQFKQWTKLSKSMIDDLILGKINMDWLVTNRVIEYITSEEQIGYYLAFDIDELKREKNNVLEQYTHVEIPQAVFGITTLSGPLANHTSSTRTIIFGNQVLNATSANTSNHYNYINKNLVVQYQNQKPIVQCLGDRLSYPTSQNIIVLLSCDGWNQEDSIKINKSSVEAGQFMCAFYTFEEIKKEHKEYIGIIDYSKTMNIKKDANYEFIDSEGLIKIGSVVNKGDVLVAKTVELKQPINGYLYKDKSLICKKGPLIVVDIYKSFNSNNEKIIKVKLLSVRPIVVGDKLSSRTGNKGIACIVTDVADMPYLEDGTVVDMIVSPLSVPSRGGVNQNIECLYNIFGCRKGTYVNGTVFAKLDLNDAIKKVEELGVKYGGHRRVFNGKTGKWMDTLMFVGPTAYQRLLKFVMDDEYATSSGPVSQLTRQPTAGKSNDGSHKIGEMELNIMMLHGSMNAFRDKFYEDSDYTAIYICRTCGNKAIVNEEKNKYNCRTCGSFANISKVNTSWTSNLLMNYLNTLNINTKYVLEDYKYQKNEEEELIL